MVGIQTRTVTCKRNDGLISNGLCLDKKPETSQLCNMQICNSTGEDITINVNTDCDAYIRPINVPTSESEQLSPQGTALTAASDRFKFGTYLISQFYSSPTFGP